MLLSYCYTFSHSASSSSEPRSSSTLASDTPATAAQPTRSPSVCEHSLECADSLLSAISDWSSSFVSSLNASLESSLNSPLKDHLQQQSKQFESYVKSAYSQLPLSSLASWFDSTSPDSNSGVQPRAPAKPFQTSTLSQDDQERKVPTGGRTTFTFVLFGAASSAAVYLLLRNRRTMNRLQTAKSFAYKDARAWRRVALDFARINALATGRVQNLVAASLGNGKVGSDIGRQIERELQEAARAVAQRRNWIREQDAKDADSAASSGHLRSFEEAWADFFDAERPGSIFGSRNGPCKQSRHSVRPDHVSDLHSDGVSFKPSENRTRSAPEIVAATHQPSVSASDAACSSPNDHQEAFQAQKLASEAEVDQTAESHEEWIGDVDLAMRERDLIASAGSLHGTDQAAVNAFSSCDAEVVSSGDKEVSAEGNNYLLPVSDLNIATNGLVRDDEPDHATASIQSLRKLQKTKLEPTQVKTTVTGSAGYSYPISDQFRDMEDIFMAAWDDSFAGLSQPLANSASAARQPRPKPRASPNRAFFDKLRSQRMPGKVKTKQTNEETTEFMIECMARANGYWPLLTHPTEPALPPPNVQELVERLESKEAELAGQKRTVRELSDRLETVREMCHDLTDEAQRRDKTHKIQIEQLEQKLGLFTVWAEEMQRRLGLETPPFFASLRKPLKLD